ncbi:MAG: hypothetical protein ACREJC_19905 [Tepidisphaeraceae bacterium]
MDEDDDQPVEELAKLTENHLDSTRIQRVAQIRRATFRVRTHALIAAAACAVVAFQLCWTVWKRWSADGAGARLLYICSAALACLGAVFFIRRARALAREVAKSKT